MEPGKKTRVLIVDDSAFMRKVLQSIIAADPQLEVCGEARDGRDAVTQGEALKPDVITMDINMPHMDGLQATEIIMSSNPRPIVVVSSESREGAEVTLKALDLGAIDFVAKPTGGIDLEIPSGSLPHNQPVHHFPDQPRAFWIQCRQFTINVVRALRPGRQRKITVDD